MGGCPFHIYIQLFLTNNCLAGNSKVGVVKLFCNYRYILSRVFGFVTNNNGFWIGWLDLLTPSLYNLSLITISYKNSQSIFSGTLLPVLSRTRSILLLFLLLPPTLSQSYITTYGQSASRSWNTALVWGLRPGFCYYQTVAVLLMWSALSDERTGLSFTISPGPRHHSHFRVRVPRDSWPYFTVWDSRLPFSLKLNYTDLISFRHGPRTENTAGLLLRACLLGFPRDRYPVSLLLHWLLPINGLGANHIENTAPLLLAACLFWTYLPIVHSRRRDS
jgi:hypothetical protein